MTYQDSLLLAAQHVLDDALPEALLPTCISSWASLWAQQVIQNSD